ncbi:MAG: AraC family transcriptional regulator [Bacteroidia bacterium]|nr:AraC family transcriptional regulator [Bacteroidia bacterium]
MISTTEYRPKSLLEEFVVCFYFNKSDKFEYSGYANPTTNQELFFNLGDNFELKNSIGQVTSQRSWISGLQSKSVSIKSSGRHITAGVIFKPWGLYTAFGINAKELTNKTIDSNLICDLSNELDNSEFSESQFFDLIEYKLLKSIKRSKMTKVMQKITNEMEQENLATLSEKLGRSKKSIIESFNKMIGLSPNKFFTLRCICDSITVLQNNTKIKLTELAYNQGFYDQAHFIKVFKEHTGLTPKEFRNRIFKT